MHFIVKNTGEMAFARCGTFKFVLISSFVPKKTDRIYEGRKAIALVSQRKGNTCSVPIIGVFAGVQCRPVVVFEQCPTETKLSGRVSHNAFSEQGVKFFWFFESARCQNQKSTKKN